MGETPLHLAAWKGRTALCTQLLCTLIFALLAFYILTFFSHLVHGANPNCENSRKETPVHFAAYSGNLDTIKLLVSSKGRLDLAGPNGTPIDVSPPQHQAALKAMLHSLNSVLFSPRDGPSSHEKDYLFIRSKSAPTNPPVLASSKSWRVEEPSLRMHNPIVTVVNVRAFLSSFRLSTDFLFPRTSMRMVFHGGPMSSSL